MATKQSTQDLQKLIINKVPDLTTFHNMENNNQINANELYFIEEQETNVASVSTGSSNGTITITTNKGTSYPVSIAGLGSNAYTSTAYAPLASPALTGTPTAPTATVGTNTTQIATTAFVQAALTGVSSPMRFIGSLGTGGTATSLPTASTTNQGYTYKVITANTYQGVAAKVGDILVSNGSSWILIPSGDEPSGTVTSITLKAGDGITLDTDNTAITSSGTRTISHKDTSSVTNLTANERTYVTGLTFDTYGHVTAYTTGTETVTNNDTKNTAGSTDTSSKIYLIGATEQSANPQTYSDDQVYVTSGQLDANIIRISEQVSLVYDSTNSTLNFNFA